MPSEISCEMRDRAYRICRDYLHGAWRLITPPEMVIKQISGGLSNLLYYCALPASHPPKATEPSEVLLRIYGQVHGEDALESVLAESVIFALLSERRLGPTLYGVFPGGRLEQFIPARPLFTRELADPELSAIIATKMANIHALNVPISKEPCWIWNTMERWLRTSQEFLSQQLQLGSEQDRSLVERLQQVDYHKEMEFLRQVVARVQSPVVFAHNDMQEGNILLKTGPKPATGTDRIALIDFEYCSYNYRGFDLANHFCEWIYEYKLPVHPYFTVDCDNYPSQEKQVNFIRTYLDAFERSRRGKPAGGSAVAASALSNGSEDSAVTQQNGVAGVVMGVAGVVVSPPSHPAEETLLQEVAAFIPASHLFWALWSIVQSKASNIPFGYMDYAVTRMEHYFKDKAKLHLDQLTKRKSDAITEEG